MHLQNTEWQSTLAASSALLVGPFLNCVAAAMLINFAFSLPITLITLQGVMTNDNGILELLSVGGCMQRNATYMRKEEPQNGH
jgi:hypothetical protein